MMIGRYQTNSQKVVQARMWAQGLTVGIMIVAGALQHSKRAAAAEHVSLRTYLNPLGISDDYLSPCRRMKITHGERSSRREKERRLRICLPGHHSQKKNPPLLKLRHNEYILLQPITPAYHTSLSYRHDPSYDGQIFLFMHLYIIHNSAHGDLNSIDAPLKCTNYSAGPIHSEWTLVAIPRPRLQRIVKKM